MKTLLFFTLLSSAISSFAAETVYLNEGDKVKLAHSGCSEGEHPSIKYQNNIASASCEKTVCLLEIYTKGSKNYYGGYIYVPTQDKNYGLVNYLVSNGKKVKRIASYNVFSSTTQLFNPKEAKMNLLKRFVETHRECEKGITILDRFGSSTFLEYIK